MIRGLKKPTTYKSGRALRNIHVNFSKENCTFNSMRKHIYLCLLVWMALYSFSQPSFTITPSLCEGNSATVTANSGTMVATGYYWYVNPGGPLISTPTSSLTSITFPTAGTFVVTLDVTDGSTVATVSNTVTVWTNPTIGLFAQSTICPPPASIGIWMSAYGANTYTWQPGGSTGTNYTVSPQPSSNTTFTVFGEDTNGCIDTILHYVQVHPSPSVFASGPSVVCSGQSNCFTASGSLVIYVWNGPCGFTDNNQNPCFAINTGCGGTFTVGGTDMNGCVAETILTVSVSPCTGLDELSLNLSQSFFPNPVKDLLNIKAEPSLNGVIIEIFDVLGNLTGTHKLTENSDTINLSEYESGIYFVRIAREDNVKEVIKIIKE
jgi:hypothetical protein